MPFSEFVDHPHLEFYELEWKKCTENMIKGMELLLYRKEPHKLMLIETREEADKNLEL